MEDIRQNQLWANYLSLLSWKDEKIEAGLAYIKPLGFFGSVIKINRADKPPSNADLKKLQKKYRPLQITFEPGLNFKDYKEMEGAGFKKDKWPLSPSKTIFINLKQSEDQLLSQMHHKTRYNISLAEKKGLAVRIANDIDGFANLWLANMRQKGNYFLTSTKQIKAVWEAFDKNAKLVLVYSGKELLAGVLLLLTNKSGHYMFAASNKTGNKLFAPTLAAWEAIRLSKKAGVEIFDFEGIYDPRYDKATNNWKGFSRFKSGFGGKEIEFAGAYTKHYFPLFQLLSKLI